MSKSRIVTVAVVLLAAAILAVNAAQTGTTSNTARTVKVKLNYTGAGTVDEQHRIFVFIFDSPNIGPSGSMPTGILTTGAKDGSVVFEGLSYSPAYLAAVFDKTGTYDGQSGPPPSGCPAAIYSKEPGVAAPIEIAEGGTAEVGFTFDDSFLMP